MLKQILATIIIFSTFTITAFADDYNYANKQACQSSLQTYRNMIAKMQRKDPNHSNEYMNMRLFFYRLVYGGLNKKYCHNGVCTWKTSASCALLDLDKEPARKVWLKLANKYIDKEVTYIYNNTYDPNIHKLPTRFLMECGPYKEGNDKFKNCRLKIS